MGNCKLKVTLKHYRNNSTDLFNKTCSLITHFSEFFNTISFLRNSCAESQPPTICGLIVGYVITHDSKHTCHIPTAIVCTLPRPVHLPPPSVPVQRAWLYSADNKPEEGNTSGSKTFLLSVLLFASSFSSVFSSPSALQECYGEHW